MSLEELHPHSSSDMAPIYLWLSLIGGKPLITVTPGANGDHEISVAKGELNDFSQNIVPDEIGTQEKQAGGTKTLSMGPVSSKVAAEVAAAGPQIIIVNLPPGPIDITVAGVDIVVREPKRPNAARSGTNRIATAASPATRDDSGDLSGILFATDPDRLRINVGRSEADAAIAQIEERGGQLVNGSGDDFSERVVDILGDGEAHRGVAILGATTRCSLTASIA